MGDVRDGASGASSTAIIHENRVEEENRLDYRLISKMQVSCGEANGKEYKVP